MPRYYDEAPLDEFGKAETDESSQTLNMLNYVDLWMNGLVGPGMFKEPKWGHLKDLHHALRLCKNALLFGTPSTQPLGKLYEVLLFSSLVAILL